MLHFGLVIPSSARLRTCGWVLAAVAASVLGGCGSDSGSGGLSEGTPVELPGLSGSTDFDDIAYSKRLDRMLVPALAGGLYMVDPETGEAEHVGGFETADSADEGRGLIFVADRSAQQIDVVDPRTGRIVASTPTGATPDYVRYIEANDELWVTEPSAQGIEVIPLGPGRVPMLGEASFIPVEGGPEGLTVAPGGDSAFTHALDGELVKIDVGSRREAARWPMGCGGAHGFPQIDEADDLVLASCDANGEVVLMDARDGRQIAHFGVGEGTSLPAYSAVSDHFYARADPGTTITTLEGTAEGLVAVDSVTVPEAGHCLIADPHGGYWTCDAEGGRVLRFTDEG